MSRRSDSQEINHHQFAIAFPPCAQKSRFWVPTHRQGVAAIQHPWPVDAMVDFRSQIANFAIVKMFARRQNATQQKGSVDRRQLAASPSLPIVHVQEMVVKAVYVRRLVVQKTQRLSNAIR